MYLGNYPSQNSPTDSADEPDFLMGLITEIQVHLVDPTTHWLEIEFQLPLIADELVYVGSSKKALGYALKDGTKTLMLESPARPYSKKKQYEPIA